MVSFDALYPTERYAKEKEVEELMTLRREARLVARETRTKQILKKEKNMEDRLVQLLKEIF